MTAAAGGGGPAGPGPSGEALDWHFSQVFGERTPGEEVQEADIISAVEFDQTGDYLATGDQGGRVVLFERAAARPHPHSLDPDERPTAAALQANPYEYRYLTEFQSHEPEFDYLKSLEIEEKINCVRWVRRWPGSASHTLLTTNDKTVKLWKVYEKRITCLSDFNVQNGGGGGGGDGALSAANGNVAAAARAALASPRKLAAAAAAAAAQRPAALLRLPRVVSSETVITARCRRAYASAHTYHVNSIALASDQQSFLSADDLRINLWHLDRADTSFNVVDIKPNSMEDLTEVITCADFHPRHAHVFGYSSSKGCIRLADMRAAALCDQHAKLFEAAEPPGPRSFFSEIIASVNDIKFVGGEGRYVLARDYMTLKLWDSHMEASPVAVFPVQEALRSRLCDLYENDAIFDKFGCCASGDGGRFATGTYSNFFRVVTSGLASERAGGEVSSSDVLLEASRDPARRRLASAKSSIRFGGFGRGGPRARMGGGSPAAAAEEALGSDLSSKVQHLAWHPASNLIATAASNSLYLFYGRGSR